jgi:hypothetical protein
MVMIIIVENGTLADLGTLSCPCEKAASARRRSPATENGEARFVGLLFTGH